MVQRRTVRLTTQFDDEVQLFIARMSSGKGRLPYSSLVEVALKELMRRSDAAEILDRYGVR